MLADAGMLIMMIAARIAIPIILTLALCYGLDRLAARRAAQLASRRQKAAQERKSPKVVRQLQCWEIKRCDPETRATCPASKRQNVPCWLALQLAGQALGEECRSCALYGMRKAA